MTPCPYMVPRQFAESVADLVSLTRVREMTVGSEVDRIRQFNRTVTQWVGALDDRFLGRDRPLGEARLLYEIGTGRAEVRELRRRLGLDSGYASRLLGSLTDAGLITVGPSSRDGRVNVAEITDGGRRELIQLDKRSDRFVADSIAPLDADQRRRLVDAMGVVERLVRAASVTTEACAVDGEPARECLARYYQEIGRRFARGFDLDIAIAADPHLTTPPHGVFLVLRSAGRAVGCGAVQRVDDDWADLKRMWIDPDVRGLGLGRRLLRELEDHAAQLGYRNVRLETNRSLTEAMALYRSAGYIEGQPHNDEPHADHWFSKRL